MAARHHSRRAEHGVRATDVGDGWGVSFYDYFRWRYIKTNSNIGPFPEFLKAENDLLAAEGYFRTGNIAAAAAKIDLSRVANGGLAALSGVITSATIRDNKSS